MKYPKIFAALAVLAIFSFTIVTTATAQETGQETGVSILTESPSVALDAVLPVSRLENPLVTVPVVQVAYPVYYYRSPTLAQRLFTRTVTVPVVSTTPTGLVTGAGYSTATVRAALFPRLKARRLASGIPVQAQAVSTTTVLVH